jgi:Cysteine dioxygenase type I
MTTTLLSSPNPLVRPRLDPARLVDIAAGIAAMEPLWRAVVRHEPGGRRPVRLLATDDVEVWVIGWLAGQGVALHDHGDSAGALVVTEGTLLEVRATEHGLVRADLRAGARRSLPHGLVHDVVNPGPAAASSVHVYSPPLQVMTRFEPGTLRRLADDPVEQTPAALPPSVAAVLLSAARSG